MEILLIGFMGSGKSCVSKFLAGRLDFHLIEMDRYILNRAGRAGIDEIIALQGEEAFRKIETEVALEVAEHKDTVISSGGGIVTSQEAMAALQGRKGVTIYLRTSFEELSRRLKGFENRPLFKNKERAEAQYTERLPLYEKYADYIIPTDGKTCHEVVDEIVNLLQRKLKWAV